MALIVTETVFPPEIRGIGSAFHRDGDPWPAVPYEPTPNRVKVATGRHTRWLRNEVDSVIFDAHNHERWVGAPVGTFGRIIPVIPRGEDRR